MPPQITLEKRCIRCGVVKDRERDFYRQKQYVQSVCKPCSAELQAVYRANNVEMLREKRRAKRAADPERYRQIERNRYEGSPGVRLTRAARDKPCVDCGIKLPPQIMELDHVRGTKVFTLGGPLLCRRPEAEVRIEIAKCDVRCPNCHRLRHHYERERLREAS